MHRDMTVPEMENLLHLQTFGHLACQEDGKPYVIPLAYYYHDGVVYGQTSTGHKTDILRRHPLVCFQTQELSADGWKSVMCWGRFEEVDFNVPMIPALVEALQQLSLRLRIVQQSVGVTVHFSADGQPQSHDGTIFRIIITERSGRLFHADA